MKSLKILTVICAAAISFAAVSIGAGAVNTETNYLRGDANGDRKVSVADSVAILQSIANRDKYKLSLVGKANGDVDGEDGITANDALTIQKLDAKVITEFPVK